MINVTNYVKWCSVWWH